MVPLRPFLAPTVACVLLASCHAILGFDDLEPRSGAAGTGGVGGTGVGGGGAGGAGGSATGAGTGGGTATGAGGSTTGGGGPAWCGGVGRLTDPLDDEDFTLDRWQIYANYGASADENGGALVATLPPDGGEVGCATWQAYDLSGRSLAVEIAPLPGAPADTEVRLSVGDDSDNGAEFEVTSNVVAAWLNVDGNGVQLASVVYDDSVHRFLGFREQGGTLYWETSGDGVNWNTLHSESIPATVHPRYARAFLWLVGDGGGVNSTTLRVESITGTVFPDEGWCPISTLNDDFDDSERSPAWFVAHSESGCNIAESGGRLTLDLQSGALDGTTSSWATSTAYDLEEGSVALEVVQAPAAGSNGVLWLSVGASAEDQIDFDIGGGHLHLSYAAGGNWSAVSDLSYSVVNHRWLRVRQQGTNVYWDVSPDGSSWSNLESTAVPFDVSGVNLVIRGAADGSPSAAVHMEVDNVNVTP